MTRMKELWRQAEELLGAEELSRRFNRWITTLIRNHRRKSQQAGEASPYTQDVTTIIDDLNARSGRRFTVTPAATAAITKIIGLGYTVVDFQRVHEVKVSQWLNNEQMSPYLRPSTLYRPSHFDEYLGEWWAMENARQELVAKRQRAKKQNQPRQTQADAREEAKRVEHLLSIPWHAHASWADFVRHTIQFPTASALAKYPMPDQIRENRATPGMSIQVLTGKSPEWAEAYFQVEKKKHNEARHDD